MSLPLVWIVEAGATPSEDAKRALEAWAKARGVELALPSDDGPAALPIDWSVAERIEKGLARVRDAMAGLELDVVERELARAQVVLREHAELPQAAWLRAEVERGWSVRWLRGNDEERAKRAWQKAAGLDGGREAGLGEKAFEAAAPITARIRLVGDGAAESGLRLDGVAIASGDVTRSEGEHALTIVDAEGRATWAEWVTLAQGREVQVRAPGAAPCSRGDLKRVKLGDHERAVDATGARCAAWVAAVGVPGAAGAVRVATCEADACGALVEWRSIASVASGWTFEPGTKGDSRSSRFKWPAWGTWAVVGVGVAGAAVGIAAAVGAFKSPAGGETQFVNGGVVVHSF